MKVSIVIPALNEREYLPKLLSTIAAQTFQDLEVVVADAGSTDGTDDIAREYGARVVEGGMPARGRNNGARASKGEFLFFLDSDVKLPKDFVENAYGEMQERYIDLATCEYRPLSNVPLDRALHELGNTMIRLSLRVDPRAPGYAIFTTQRLFDRVGGFDESITVAEDGDFVKRASKFRPLEYLESTHLLVSVRRLKKEGRLAYAMKNFRVDLYRSLRGEIRDDQFDYEFGNYDENRHEYDEKWLEKLERFLVNYNNRGSARSSQDGPAVLGSDGETGNETPQALKTLEQFRSSASELLSNIFRSEPKQDSHRPDEPS